MISNEIKIDRLVVRMLNPDKKKKESVFADPMFIDMKARTVTVAFTNLDGEDSQYGSMPDRLATKSFDEVAFEVMEEE